MNIKDNFDRLRDADNWLLPIDETAATKRRSHRAKWPLTVLGAAAAVTAIAAVPVAIGHHGDNANPANPSPNMNGAIPWKALKASASTPKVNHAAKAGACSPQELSIKILPGINPAMGTDYVMLDVKNAGGDACTLRDSALTGLRWGNGHHPKAPVAATDEAPVIHAGASQKYRLGFPGSCLASSSDTASVPTDATIGGQRVSVTSGGIPAALDGCDAVDVSAVGITGDGGASAQQGTALSPFADLHADMDVAANVVAGTLPYTITLTNNGAAPFSFADHCPNYTQGITFPGADPIDEHYQLNCDGAGELAPGDSATFAMQVTIPSDAITAGDVKLLWHMDDGGPDAGELLNAPQPTQ